MTKVKMMVSFIRGRSDQVSGDILVQDILNQQNLPTDYIWSLKEKKKCG